MTGNNFRDKIEQNLSGEMLVTGHKLAKSSDGEMF